VIAASAGGLLGDRGPEPKAAASTSRSARATPSDTPTVTPSPPSTPTPTPTPEPPPEITEDWTVDGIDELLGTVLVKRYIGTSAEFYIPGYGHVVADGLEIFSNAEITDLEFFSMGDDSMRLVAVATERVLGVGLDP